MEVRLAHFSGLLRADVLSRLNAASGWTEQWWGCAAGLERLKSTGGRTVARLPLGSAVVYLKHFARRTWLDTLKHVVRGDPARREFQRLRWLQRQGVAASRPLGWGNVCGVPFGPGSVLITAEVEEAMPLAHYHNARGRVRRRAIEAVAQYVARLHEAGAYHRDLHAENLLVRGSGQAGGLFRADDLVLIDLGRARIAPRAGWPDAVADLATLFSSWNQQLARSERLRFLLAYRAVRGPECMPDLAQAARDIESAGWSMTYRVVRRLDRRAVRDGEGFTHRRIGRWELFATADGVADLSLPYPPAGTSKRTNGKRAWRLGHALALRGIPAICPRALVRRRRWLGWEEWLLADTIPQAVPLERIVASPEELPDPHRALCQLAIAAGAMLGRLHRWRFRAGAIGSADLLAAHRDGRWSWIIGRPEAVGEGVRTAAARRRDLRAFLRHTGLDAVLSRTQLLRLLHAYLAVWPPDNRPLRALWPAIARRRS